MFCMVRPTQVFMVLRFGIAAAPIIAPRTIPMPIPRQRSVHIISFTLLVT